MIVRILSEGQYQLDSAYLDRLNEIDNRLVSVVANGTDEEFSTLFEQMLALVREHGQPIPAEELATSDVVLPDPNSHIDDIKPLFVGEGWCRVEYRVGIAHRAPVVMVLFGGQCPLYANFCTAIFSCAAIAANCFDAEGETPHLNQPVAQATHINTTKSAKAPP